MLTPEALQLAQAKLLRRGGDGGGSGSVSGAPSGAATSVTSSAYIAGGGVPGAGGSAAAGTRFTCFTSTKVQILAPAVCI